MSLAAIGGLLKTGAGIAGALGGGRTAAPSVFQPGPVGVNVGAPVFPAYPMSPAEPTVSASLDLGGGDPFTEKVLTGVAVALVVAVVVKVVRK